MPTGGFIELRADHATSAPDLVRICPFHGQLAAGGLMECVLGRATRLTTKLPPRWAKQRFSAWPCTLHLTRSWSCLNSYRRTRFESKRSLPGGWHLNRLRPTSKCCRTWSCRSWFASPPGTACIATAIATAAPFIFHLYPPPQPPVSISSNEHFPRVVHGDAACHCMLLAMLAGAHHRAPLAPRHTAPSRQQPSSGEL